MAEILEILKYILPSLVVLAAAYYLIKLFIGKEFEEKKIQLSVENQKISLPIRLQAYERLVLLLERMEPSALLLRINQPGMRAADLQNALIQNIRSEFEHNLSQQLYVSNLAWDLVKHAREEALQRINAASNQLKEDATATELVSLILVNEIESGTSAVRKAMEQLKSEARTLF